MGKVQFLNVEGKEFAVVPREEWESLRERAGKSRDAARVEAAMTRLDRGDTELVPHDVVRRLVAGENPVRVWREYRALTATALAESAAVSRSYLSQIERGTRDGTVEVMGRLADALGVSLDDLRGAA